MTRQERPVLQVLERLPLSVQQPLYSLDDLIALGQEKSEKVDVRFKRHRTKTFACHHEPRNEFRSMES